MKNMSRYFSLVMLLILGLFFPFVGSAAVGSLLDDALLEGEQITKQYLVYLSGTVMNEPFSGARALLTLSGPSAGSRYDNPYLVTIQGFPKNNSRNSFFWNSGYTEMTAIANEITCDIKRTFVKEIPTYFMFLSPDLLKHTGSLEMRAGDEGKKFAERVALPTRITARAGKLKLRIHSNTISGTVWMKGYDKIEKSYVLYSAKFYGNRSYKQKPKQEGKKGTVAGIE